MRLIDVIISLVGLLILLPIYVVVAILIKIDSKGPFFYRSMRIGKNGRTFRLIKFRSMVADADMNGPRITAANDSRITYVGRLIRKTKIDELPQLLNVIKGDMSLVGPRPEDPVYVALYTSEQKQTLSVRPGITSMASLHYRHEEDLLKGTEWEQTYLDVVMPHKLEIELDYMKHRTIWTDIYIILETLLLLIKDTLDDR